MNKKLLLIFTILLFSMTVSATDYFVAELSGETLTFKKTTTAPDEVTSWDATNTSPFVGWWDTDFTTVVFDESFADARPNDCSCWFYKYPGAAPITTIVGMEYLNTSNVVGMSGMFEGCKKLTTIDISHFDTRNVTDMSGMFYGCQQLASLDFRNFDTRKATKMDRMFYECQNLVSLDLSSFDTSNVTDMWWMFEDCSNLTSLDISNFDTRNVTRMDNMFRGCGRLASLNLSSFNTNKVTTMNSMFCDCSSIVYLDLSSFDTNNVTNMEGMFTRCTYLETIVVSDNWSVEKVSVYEWTTIFDKCNAIVGGKGTTYNGAYIVKQYAHIDGGTDNPGYLSAAITLADAVDNSTTISDYDTNKVKVTLSDRTLYKDGKWNTLCLPFNVTLAGSALEGATARTLTAASVSGETLYLTFGDAVATLEAGVPYIIKWDSGDDIVEPSFLPVFISSEANNFTSADGKVSFVGNYAPVAVSANNEHVLFMGGDNTLYYPTTNRSLRCQRAHFELADGVTARNYVIDFGEGETTTISGVLHQKDMTSTNAWFSIDGRRLASKPLTKGVYIHNGRKEVVK